MTAREKAAIGITCAVVVTACAMILRWWLTEINSLRGRVTDVEVVQREQAKEVAQIDGLRDSVRTIQGDLKKLSEWRAGVTEHFKQDAADRRDAAAQAERREFRQTMNGVFQTMQTVLDKTEHVLAQLVAKHHAAEESP